MRDVVRVGVVEIGVLFSVTPKWLKKLSEYKQQESNSVLYFDSVPILISQIVQLQYDINFVKKYL